MDQAKVDAMTERIVHDVNAAMSCLNVYLGHRLGLFQAIADTGPVTPSELATKTGYQERYLREWLECLAVGDVLGHDETTGPSPCPRSMPSPCWAATAWPTRRPSCATCRASRRSWTR